MLENEEQWNIWYLVPKGHHWYEFSDRGVAGQSPGTLSGEGEHSLTLKERKDLDKE